MAACGSIHWSGVASAGWRDRQKLIWRSTFIEVHDYDGEGQRTSAEQGRPLSAPPAISRSRFSSIHEGAADVFETERAYVQALSDSAIWVNGSEDHMLETASPKPELRPSVRRRTPKLQVPPFPQGHLRLPGPSLPLQPSGVATDKKIAVGRAQAEAYPASFRPALQASNPNTLARVPVSALSPVGGISPVPPLPTNRSAAFSGAQPLTAGAPDTQSGIRQVPPLPLPFPAVPAKAIQTAMSPSGLLSPSSSTVSASASTTPPVTFSNQACPNPGSFAHPDMCARPCMYIVASNCANGSNCEFCHLDHSKRPSRLEKRHREWLRNMQLEDSIAIILPVVHTRVLSIDSSSQTKKFLEELVAVCHSQGRVAPGCEVLQERNHVQGGLSTAEASGPPSSRPPERVQRSERRLLTLLLRSMNLRTLLLSLGRLLDWPDGDQVHSLVTNLVSHLRAQPAENTSAAATTLPHSNSNSNSNHTKSNFNSNSAAATTTTTTAATSNLPT